MSFVQATRHTVGLLTPLEVRFAGQLRQFPGSPDKPCLCEEEIHEETIS